jgi:hypothetical protein
MLLDNFGHIEQHDRSFGVSSQDGHNPPVAGQPSAQQRVKRWVPAIELSGHTMDRSMRIRINDFLTRNGSPVITEPRSQTRPQSVLAVSRRPARLALEAERNIITDFESIRHVSIDGYERQERGARRMRMPLAHRPGLAARAANDLIHCGDKAPSRRRPLMASASSVVFPTPAGPVTSTTDFVDGALAAVPTKSAQFAGVR